MSYLIEKTAITILFGRDYSPDAKRNWKKVLYENQDVPDNYVHHTFLQDMRKNLFLREYDYKTLLIQTGSITQQINAVIVFIMSFVYLQSSIIDPYILNMLSGAVLLVSYVLLLKAKAGFDIKAVVVFCTASFVLSPVLMSLTHSISTDTIYAMTTVMLLVHLFSHDYVQSEDTQEVSAVVSFNAGIFATVCLASRSSSLAQGFSLIVFSVIVFGVWPTLRRSISVYFEPYVDLFTTFVLFFVTNYMLWYHSVTIATLSSLFFMFITFVCPALLIHLQPIKNNVYGPWDEAVVAER